jgi:hypothetical protein
VDQPLESAISSQRTITLRRMSVRRLSRGQARRIAVRAQLLDAARPDDLLTMVRQLTLLQIDPTSAVAPMRIWWRGAGLVRRTSLSS